jgi:Trk-type K+ transport system membrane component
VRRVIGRVVLFSLATEAVVAVVLTARFAVGYGLALPSALYSGVFHAVSAFNNAGFSLNADSLMPYVTDPWISLTVCAAVIVGGLGFPVVFELARSWRRPKTWSVLTRITVVVTAALLVVGTLGMLVAERGNPGTLGRLPVGNGVLAAFTAAVMPRTAGFNNLDIAAYRPETLLLNDALMFIGGGSAGTAGGIKVTTFGLLAYVLWAELRGDPDVEVGRRRVPGTNQRQALAVVLLGIGLVAVATFLMEALTDFGFGQVTFETISAFATVGLSTGITAGLPPAAQVLLVLLMYIGRIGPLTLASGLALRERARRHQLPEERTIVG